ncbi:MSCRAMM family protein [Paraglaciecola arctica]|uniref:MSCRAMM family protein n=1 Tax=Paraglaciecola arctica TaxID=1128911 RepID=UPI001C06C763|nr:hypothetical protein [Paraglaciecola arctica]MBU3003037.1 hypothetical protein [Paraglaciecola arctica]
MEQLIRMLLICSTIFLLSSIAFTVSASPQTPAENLALTAILKRIQAKYQAIETSQENKFNDSANLIEVGYTQAITLSDNQSDKIRSPEQDLDDIGVGIPEGEELLLSIYIDNLYLADVFAYKSEQGAKISAQSIFVILDFPINIDIEEKKLDGWFIQENNYFEFYFNTDSAPSATVNGKSEIVEEEDFFIEDNDVYIEGRLLSKWFGLNLSYKFNDLRAILKPSQTLPIQARLARESKNINSTDKPKSTLPWKRNAYQMFSSPLVDVQMQQSASKDDNSNYTNFSALGSHDVAFLNTQYYVAGRSEGGLSDARVKFSRELKSGLFGFLPAANIQFGDINSISIDSNFSSGLNRGVSFTKALTEVKDNQQININGDIQPSWDVELYQNNILIDKQTSVQTGRYEFNDIDLLFGYNNFEIISYGPQGQVEREFREVFIDSNALQTSEQDYGFSVTQQGKSLLGVNDELTSNNEGVLFSGVFSQGITDWLTISLGQSSLFSDTGEDEFNYSIGTDVNLYNNVLVNADMSINQDNLLRGYLTGRTQWMRQSLFYSFRTQEFLISGIDTSTQKVTDTQHLFRMGGQFLQMQKYRLNYDNQLLFRSGINDDKNTRFTNNLSLSAGRFSVQHTLDWQKNESALDSSEYLNGYMQTQRQLGRVFSRLSVGYSIHPENKIENVKTELSWTMFEKLQSDFKFIYIPESDKYRADLGLSWQHENFNLNGYFSFDDEDEWTVGLFLRFGIGYDIENNRAFMSSTSLANSGAMSVRVFEDENNDGIFNEGENVIEGAKAKAIQAQRQAFSGDDGIALIKNLPANVKTDITLDRDTLGDPFFIPSTKGVSITPRKGFLDNVDYPVVTSGEIDGTIYSVDTRGNENNLAYVAINLLNENGDVVETTQSEYDGYYLFVDLVPGQYFVSVADDYLKQHKLESIENLAVNLTVQGDVINGSDFTLLELDFTEGFAVSAGSFDSLTMLKVYWHLIQRRYRAKLKQTAFYVEREGSGRFSLNLAFYKDKSEAYQACKQISGADIQCNVEEYEFVSQ